MTETGAGPLTRATWRRLRFWIAFALLVVAGAAAVAFSTATTPVPLDPTSPAHAGSQALAQLLEQRGTSVMKLSSPADAAATPESTTVLVVDADSLGTDQLQELRGHRLVLLNPDVAALAAVTSDYEGADVVPTGSIVPGCSWAGAQAAGAVTFPSGTSAYSGPSTCYAGALVVTDRLVVIGSAGVLRNDQLANNNIAALDLNAISADGSAAKVAWLMPSVEDTGSGSPSVWALFPPWAHHAFWWLLVIGVLIALWQGRRLGPVVTEPLPVVVRAAEVVEGHGRLYRRAGARERAAALLRAATGTRLATQLGLDRHASAAEVAAVLSASRGRTADRAAATLAGAPPVDDRALLELARDLADLETGTVPNVAGSSE